jgi:hypothetical protein
VRESRSPGSVRGVLSNGHSYRDRPEFPRGIGVYPGRLDLRWTNPRSPSRLPRRPRYRSSGALVTSGSRVNVQFFTNGGVTPKEQEYYVEQFHSLCAQGIGKNCRFYRLLMDRYLHNLVADARAHCGMGSAELLTNSDLPIDRQRAVVER